MIYKPASHPAYETPATSRLPLFREQALERFRGSTWQPALLSKPVPGYLLVASAVLAGACLLGFACSFEFARKEQVQGYLTPPTGWSRVTAKSPGVIYSRLVAPGDTVESGEVLLEISSGDGVQQSLTLQEQVLKNIEERREAERLQANSQANEARRAQLAVERDLQQTGIQEQKHALAIEEARVRVEGKTRVLSPRSGTVASMQVEVGDGVQPGQVLLDIVPRDSVLQARLFAPSAALGFVEPGKTVRVYLDAFPYERHGVQVGETLSISRTTLTPGERSTVPGQDGPVYRIDVGFPAGFDLLPEQVRALRPGMSVTADLVYDYGTLVDWLLEPLRGTVRRL